jgi:type II secretory pathway pseudopilin PulG
MITLIVVAVLLALAVASLLGRTADSRDERFGLAELVGERPWDNRG